LDNACVDTSFTQILKRLLALTLSDADLAVRSTILTSFDPKLDYYLAQTDHLRLLFMLVNDGNFAIRELAVKVLGRLASRNPAYVIPFLRKLLIEVKLEIESGAGSDKAREQSVQLLAHLLGTRYDSLVSPYETQILFFSSVARVVFHCCSLSHSPCRYVEPLLRALLPKLKDPNRRLLSTVSPLP
jgi:phosphatidylinositol kinase/protein kinase (PI-3  family)